METNIMSLKSVGPYIGVQKDEKVVKTLDGKERTFRLLLYGAYNAFGLIGSESNGVVVLDEDNLCVIADEIACEPSGYFGASEKQRRAFEVLKTSTSLEFRALVNAQRRIRHEI
jgi:hypothetical protein